MACALLLPSLGHTDDSQLTSSEHLLAAQRRRLGRVPNDLHRYRLQLKEHATAASSDLSAAFLYRQEVLTAMAEGASAQGQPDARGVLTQFDAQLAARGVSLMVVLVPPRPTIYGHRQLTGIGPEAELWPELTSIVLDLMERGLDVVDLRAAFVDRGEGAADRHETMHRWDHHWTSAGMATAARIVAARLRDADRRGVLPAPDLARFSRSSTLVAAPTSLLDGNGVLSVMTTSADVAPVPVSLTLIRDLHAVPLTGIGPVLVFGDSQAIVGAGYPQGGGFVNYLAAELGFAVPYAGQTSPASMVVDNYARWFGHVEPQPEVVVLVFDAAALVRDDWRPTELPTVPLVTGPAGPVHPDTAAADGTVYPGVGSTGPVTSLRVLGQVVTVSAPPELSRVLYGDALSVAEVEPVAPMAEKGERLAILDYVARNGELTDFADVKVGDRWWLDLLPVSAGESDALRATMIVDDTDGFDLERFFVTERSPAAQPLPARAGYQHEWGPNTARVWVIGAGAVVSWPPLPASPLGPTLRSAAPGDGVAQALWRLERAAREIGKTRHHPEAIALVPGDADLLTHGVAAALALVSQLVETAQFLLPHSRLFLTTVVPDAPPVDEAVAVVDELNAEIVERYRRAQRVELVDLSASEPPTPEAVATALAAKMDHSRDPEP